jgi:hypothetical protein
MVAVRLQNHSAPRRSPEERELFEKTLAAIWEIMGDLKEISSKQLTEKLAEVKDGPWAAWGDGREKKPISQKSLAARTTSPPSMSSPRTQGVKATSALSSSNCSETCLGLDHPPASSNRAAAREAIEADLP